MSDNDQPQTLIDRFFKPGLTRNLLFWFLPLALLPLALVCLIGYQQSSQALRAAAIEMLSEGITQQTHFIDNWFGFRFKDLRVQAESRQNARFIESLSEGLHNSGKTAEGYVDSYQWATLVEKNKANLVQLMQVYSYYYDLFLIDLDGNILFSVKQEEDLGRNLFSGSYKSSLFAGIVKQSLETGEALFSDFENYAPSGGIVAGFLSAPLIDESGEKIGVFAAQLKVDTITELTLSSQRSNASLVSYLIGTDLFSRTAIRSLDDVLSTKIETAQTALWVAGGGDGAKEQDEQSEIVFDYIGPFGQKVLGVHQTLTIGQIKWALISEVDEAEALAPALWMAKLTLLILIFMFLVVVVVAIFVSRRITRPLKVLVGFSERAAVGQLDQQVKITSKDEVGQLADAFNLMIDARQTYETELELSSEQRQKALLELEEQKFALDQHSIVAITDASGTITFVNQKFVDISGYSYKELIGQNHRLLNSGHHPKSFFQQMYATLANDDVWHDEICNKAKDGHLYWVESTILPFINSKGEITSYIAIRTDVTSRKQAELNSQNSLSIVEATLEATDNGVVVLNQFDKTIHYNQRFLDLLRLTKDQVIFGDVSSMLEVIISQLINGEAFAEIVSGVQAGVGVLSDGRADFKDGQILDFSARELRLPGDKPGHVWSFNDVTEQVLAAEEITRAKDEAEEATRAKSDFLANMSHEIRTPMNGVLGMLSLLSSSDLSSKQRHQVRLARSSGEALLILINDILDFSKIEAGKLEMEFIDFDLRQLLGELAESMALQALSKRLEIVLDLTQIEQSRVKGDPTRIRQLFTNLVGNALKFTAAGEVVIRAALKAGAEGEIVLSASVSDTGIGIPSSRIKHLFDSFSQVDSSTTREFGGTGLGLAIVKNLCELMGGDINVTSEPGGGSCFAFTLRLGVSEQAALVRPAVDLRGVRILVVDDNSTNREVLEQQLSLWGAYVTEADSAASALRILNEQAEEPFPVAIVDMQMPEMDGAGLGKAIRADARFQSTQLIMMTSMSEPGDARFFADLGFAAYFPKPTTTSDLFDALAVVLGGGEALLAANPLVTHNYLQSLIEHPGRASTQCSDDRRASRLLLVEDNVINQQVAMGMLEDMDYYPDIAENGAVAIEMLRQAADDSPYDLILMDCQMPVLDGYAATAKIRSGEAGERNSNISIVAMTANAMAGDRAKCLQAGMNGYIAKPIDPDILENSLVRYLTQDQSGETPINTPEFNADTDANYSSNNARGPVQVEAMGALQREAVWDREGLLKRVRGKESLLVTLAKQFMQDMPEQVAQLEEAVSSEDIPAVASVAHSVKGVAGNLSGVMLQRLAASLEHAAVEQDMATIKQQWPSILEQYECLRQTMAAFLLEQEGLQTSDEEADSVASMSSVPEELNALIDKVVEKLEQGSFVDADELQNLKPYCTQGDGKLLLERLFQQLAQFDMETAAKTLQAIGPLLKNTKKL